MSVTIASTSSVNTYTPPYSPELEPEAESEEMIEEIKLCPNEPLIDSTFITIDEKSAKRIKKLVERVGLYNIFSWIGKSHWTPNHYLRGKSDTISFREARIINGHSEKQIININEANLKEFKVIELARIHLRALNKKHDFSEICKKLKFKDNYLEKIKDGRISNITKEDAKTFESHFGGRDIFCMSKILEQAKSEKIMEIIHDPDLLASIKIEDNKLTNLDSTIKSSIIKAAPSFRFNTRNKTSIRNCILINELSHDKIIDISVANLVSVPCPPKIQDEIFDVFQTKYPNSRFTVRQKVGKSELTYRKLKFLMDGMTRSVEINTAKQVNLALGQDIFNFEEILKNAKDAALRFYNSLQISKEVNPSTPSAKKRKTSEISAEEEITPPLKKAKTNHVEERNDEPSALSKEAQAAAERDGSQHVMLEQCAAQNSALHVEDNPEKPERPRITVNFKIHKSQPSTEQFASTNNNRPLPKLKIRKNKDTPLNQSLFEMNPGGPLDFFPLPLESLSLMDFISTADHTKNFYSSSSSTNPE